MKTVLKYLRAYWLFVRIVWRDFHGVRINVKTAWEVARGIWIESW